MRIAIVNDVKMARDFLRLILEKSGMHQVAWIAADGAEAIKKCEVDIPDIILMDLIMPVIDGVKATQIIMENTPCAILIVTATIEGNVSKVFEAMGYGALDVVKTPTFEEQTGGEAGSTLLKKIDVIGRYLRISLSRAKHETLSTPIKCEKVPPLLVIGASTGGPMALAKILSKLKQCQNFFIIIIQHIDEQFTQSLACWLSKQIEMTVDLAREGEIPKAGKILIAGQDKHLILTSELTLHYQFEPLEIPFHPSVDVFFHSIAQFWPENGIALLLTGMGSDGARGLKSLYDKGWYTIAQNQASCIVYGMPKSAIELGAVSEVVSLEEMHKKIIFQYEKWKMKNDI